MNFSHYSVMLDECINSLDIRSDGIYVDCTAGGGGHSLNIAKKLGNKGRLICIDQDDDALDACRKRLAQFSFVTTLIKSNFDALSNVLDHLNIDRIDGVIWDLGVSSYQLDEADRGFSYMADAPLDMRMNRDISFTAEDIVNTYSEDELRRIISEYGEEKYASRVATGIVKAREQKAIKTTVELAEIISSAIPPKSRYGESKHPAKRTFQAIRIEVNRELDVIKPSIEAAVERLNPGGRASVITFHSLEDRIVKKTFASLAQGCTCPSDFPVCVCNNKPKIKIITKKPIVPTEDELEENPRSRSAKLRVAEKL